MDIRNTNEPSEIHDMYLVYNPKSGAPYKLHSFEEALEESKRLAKLNPEKPYYILKVQGHSIGSVGVSSSYRNEPQDKNREETKPWQDHFIRSKNKPQRSCDNCWFNDKLYCNYHLEFIPFSRVNCKYHQYKDGRK